MTKDDKLTIYNLLKTASGNYYGYVSPVFAGGVPDFADDVKSFADDDDTISTSEDFSASATDAARTESFDSTNSFTDADDYPNAAPDSQDWEEYNNFAPENYDTVKDYSKVTDAAQTSITLPAIAAKIAECHACPLCQGRKNTVPGMGVASPYVLVVGEGPGHDEDVSGLPFVGAAGKLLDKMLAAIQLDRNVNCYIANVVKCRPPNNRTPTYEEAAACGGFLRSQIDVLKPKMILAAGRTAAHYLLQTDAPLGKLRGTFYNYHAAYGDIPLLVTYHPSALLRDESNKRPAWEDLKMFRARLLEIAPEYVA